MTTLLDQYKALGNGCGLYFYTDARVGDIVCSKGGLCNKCKGKQIGFAEVCQHIAKWEAEVGITPEAIGKDAEAVVEAAKSEGVL